MKDIDYLEVHIYTKFDELLDYVKSRERNEI